MAKTLYDTLDLNSDASPDQIQKAYKDKAKKLHPDKGGSDKEMAEVNHAYLILKDPIKRERYDKTGEETEVPFDKKFENFCNNIFMKLIEQEDVDYSDLIGLFKKQCDLHRRKLVNVKSELNSGLNKLDKVLKRLSGGKDGRIAKVVEGNINGLKMEIKKVEDEIDFMKAAEEIISSHTYNFDSPEDPNLAEYNYFFNILKSK